MERGHNVTHEAPERLFFSPRKREAPPLVLRKKPGFVDRLHVQHHLRDRTRVCGRINDKICA